MGRALVPEGAGRNVDGAGIMEETALVDETGGRAGGTNNTIGATEGHNGIGESINRISVVEGLGAEDLVEGVATLERRAVVNVRVGLDYEDKLLARVVEVELDLVGGGTDRLITSELELLDEILVGVLRHATTLVGVKEDIIDVEGRGNKRLRVSGGRLNVGLGGCIAGKRVNRPEDLINGAEVEVDLDLVILERDKGERKAWVAAIPELKGNVEGGLGQGIAGSANLAGRVRVAGSIDVIEGRISDVGQLGGVTNHLVVATLLLRRESELVPDVHPVTILAIDALTADLNLNLRDHLLAGEVQPTSVETLARGSGNHTLVQLWESDLEVCAEGQVTIARDSASDTTTEIGLAVESLLDRLHREVSVSAVCYLPEGNLGIACKVDILSAISNKLH